MILKSVFEDSTIAMCYTLKTGRYDIAQILLKVALNTNKSKNFIHIGMLHYKSISSIAFNAFLLHVSGLTPPHDCVCPQFLHFQCQMSWPFHVQLLEVRGGRFVDVGRIVEHRC